MKHALVVSATPEPKSFVASMASVTVKSLEQAGYCVSHSDLYAMNWNPVASASDFEDRANPDYLVYALEQRNGTKNNVLSPDIQAELAKLIKADLLVLNFPIYWFSTPAILKGWIDRVLVSGVCYGGMRFYDRGGMKGKRALVATALGGQPHMFADYGIHGPIQDMLRPLLQGTLAYTGFDVLDPFFAWHVPYISQQEREQIIVDYETCLMDLDNRAKLRFPSMDQFDEKLCPKEPQ